MKKTGSLKINQLENYSRIGDQEQMALKGGIDVKTLFQNALSEETTPLYWDFNSWWNSASSAINDFIGDASSLAYDTAEEGATWLLNKLGGGSSVLEAPFFMIDNPTLIPGYQDNSYPMN